MGSTTVSLLVVDDEVDSCKNLSDIFTDVGYRVEVAYYGTDALELMRNNSDDVCYKPFDVDQLIAKIEHLAGNHNDSS